ncbi:hypothetical protein HYC85_029771 [Camellia sinensis]|uniref:Uncharacterized protein n=1 Tax=Camellia sinensis TaxID=4442 RepID=A0A7J7FYU2_CAMSI|nr:hypothetical protein HYC85_029771 [Camellia sinensis]
MENNTHSYINLDFDQQTGRFVKYFIYFHACIDGFKYCHLLLFPDGTFFKRSFKGNWLVATAKDGNQAKPKFTIVDYVIALPIIKRPPGRPQQKRIPSKGEVMTRFMACAPSVLSTDMTHPSSSLAQQRQLGRCSLCHLLNLGDTLRRSSSTIVVCSQMRNYNKEIKQNIKQIHTGSHFTMDELVHEAELYRTS